MSVFDCNACFDSGTIFYDKSDSDSLSEVVKTPCPMCTGTHTETLSVGLIQYYLENYVYETAEVTEQQNKMHALFDVALAHTPTRVDIKMTDEMHDEWQAFLDDSEG